MKLKHKFLCLTIFCFITSFSIGFFSQKLDLANAQYPYCATLQLMGVNQVNPADQATWLLEPGAPSIEVDLNTNDGDPTLCFEGSEDNFAASGTAYSWVLTGVRSDGSGLTGMRCRHIQLGHEWP